MFRREINIFLSNSRPPDLGCNLAQCAGPGGWKFFWIRLFDSLDHELNPE